MSKEKFNDNCPGCKPVILDPTTGKVIENSPVNLALQRVWSQASRAEREAFHDFTCLNSREPQVLYVVSGLMKRLEFALKAANQ